MVRPRVVCGGDGGGAGKGRSGCWRVAVVATVGTLAPGAVLGSACMGEKGERETSKGGGAPRTSTDARGVFVPRPPGRPLRCTIVGTEQDDVLVGTAGNDVICGLDGADSITGGPGNDVLSGGPGSDTVAYASAAHGVRVRLDYGATGDGKDVLFGVENAVGSPHDDVLVGTSEPNGLRGGRGADRLVGKDHRPYDLLDGGRGLNLCVADPADRRRNCRHPRVRSHKRGVPILVYHVIGDPKGQTPFKDLWVSPRVLARQMRYLDRHGYEVVGLQEVYDYWHGGPLPTRPIVVSFDDGFANHYTRARRILAAHRWAGTLNLALSHFRKPGWGLSERMVRGLIRDDWELDCHSRTHADLPGLSAAGLAREVAGSRRFLRRMFGVPVNFFAYPSGAFDAAVVAAVRRAGYQGATTTKYGLARPSERYALDRIVILRSDGVMGLAKKLRAAVRPL
jgi:peptidoglycan/xylan/chitin deacetylase (PgdA/CDA1 family)